MATKKSAKPERPAPPSPSALAGTQAEQERKLVLLSRRVAQRFLQQEGVTSVGVGYKNGTGPLCIQFTVDRKVAPEALALSGVEEIPASFTDEDGTVVLTDVLVRRYQTRLTLVDDRVAEAVPTPALQRRRPMDPMRPGISVANAKGSAGTLGCFVFDGVTGEPYILSNWHVLHGPEGDFGDPIVQPGPNDGGSPIFNTIGTLVRSHLGMAGDCAVARIQDRQFNTAILETNVVPKRFADVNLGDLVVKSGRTTGVTRGIVRRVGVVAKVDYGGSVHELEVGGFEIGPEPGASPTVEISGGGDSGSLWMSSAPGMADVAVGLHFAGETDPDPGAEHALAADIRKVLTKLNVRLTAPATATVPPGLQPPEVAVPAEQGDAPLLTLDTLDQIDRRFQVDPVGVLGRARRLMDPTMTESQLRTALDRARRELRRPRAVQEAVRRTALEAAGAEAAAEAIPNFNFTPDPAIPIDPGGHKFEVPDDVIRWLIFAGPGFLAGGTGVIPIGDREPFRPHANFTSGFVYPIREATLASPIEVAMFSDFGTGVYHSLYIAKQIGESKADLAFHCGDVYYAGRKSEFRDHVDKPLGPMLDATELFMLNSNHEMLSGGKWYFDFLDRKRRDHPAQQRQEGSYFVVRNSRFQILGIDCDWDIPSRLTGEGKQNEWISQRLAEGRTLGLTTIFLSANEPYQYGQEGITPLYRDDLKSMIDRNISLWFWGNNHYCALFDRDDDLPFIGTCIGHGGFPYNTQRDGRHNPAPRLFLETEARFPAITQTRQDVGNNGWCKMRLHADGSVELTYLDWMSRVRHTALLSGNPLRITPGQ